MEITTLTEASPSTRLETKAQLKPEPEPEPAEPEQTGKMLRPSHGSE
jgi:hypothetical protein